MQLKSLEKVLEGIGKLRAASVVAWAANSAAFLGLHLSSHVQAVGLTGGTILLAAVNAADGYIRGQHVSALPALIAQGAESVAQVQDPRVEALADSVATLAQRVESVESRPVAPTVPEIVSALVDTKAAAAPVDPTTPAS